MKKINVIEAAAIKIEKGIPFIRRAGNRETYPFARMDVGDSFLLPAGHRANHGYGMAREATTQALRRGEKKKFKSAKVPEGYRIWRVE